VYLRHIMKTYTGVEVKLNAFLTSPLDGGEWVASRRGRLNPGTQYIGIWVGVWASLDAVAKRKKSHQCPSWELNLGRPNLYSD
jgi:hypothetical protein